jgi:hypothetical protein
MEKLRITIEEYKRWKPLELYIDRMEASLESDFSLTIENAKALLESIGKEICTAKGETLPVSPTVNDVLKKSFSSLGYSNQSLVNQVSRSLANIGQEVGGLRNEISPTSHGKSLEDLRHRNSKVDLLTREFLIDSTLVIAVFLIRAFEERRDITSLSDFEPVEEELLKYDELENFNDSWDESFGDFEMGDYSYTASEILFNVDYKAYKAEYTAFTEVKPEAETETEEE